MSNSQRQQVMIRDLVEEAKKRIVILAICAVGLSYLMSLTSSSVWVNLPAAASLIILLRYFSLDYEMRRKAAGYNSKPSSVKVSQSKPLELSKSSNKSDWRRKVNSPVVEDAVDHFTRHIVSEWVTDLWYSKITPDNDGPEELVQIMNDLIGEFSTPVKNVNLVDLLTRDLVFLLCTHLELFRASQAKIGRPKFDLLTFEQRDQELKLVLAAENKLHPALFSAEAEHKVLQHMMEGFISFTLKSEDLHCSFFHYISRELLACAVMRPVLNLANPRFINERIERLVLSKANKGVNASQEASQSKRNESPRISTEKLSKLLDPTVTGVELVQLKTDQSRNRGVTLEADSSQDPLLSIAPRSSRSWISPPSNSQITNGESIEEHHSGREWGEVLDMISSRKTAALTPENFENMWAKGRDYQRKEDENRPIEQVPQRYSANDAVAQNHTRKLPKPAEKVTKSDTCGPQNAKSTSGNHPTIENSHDKDKSSFVGSVLASCYEDDGNDLLNTEEDELSVSSSYTSEEEDKSDVTGIDSPVTKVWDGKTNRNIVVSHIHHPLEHRRPKRTRRNYQNNGLFRSHSSRKSSRSSNQKVHVWQEIERTSFLSGDGQDILSSKGHAKSDTSSEDSDLESSRRIYSGNTATSSTPNAPIPENYDLNNKSHRNSLTVGSFFRLTCEVSGANIVKSGYKTFAVYSISVTDANNHSWSIKRRFRHFEELHRCLKEYPEYNLHLPPKHFLSTGLDVPVIRERRRLLDLYLKKLMQIPNVSGSIEVWDFLCVDSQTYVFSNSLSIIETLSVDLDDKPSEKGRKASESRRPVADPVLTKGPQQGSERNESMMWPKSYFSHGAVRMETTHLPCSPIEKISKDGQSKENSGMDLDSQKGKDVKARAISELEETAELHHDSATELMLPSEWVPPNLTAPILDLVDIIFQLQDGGWIRKKAFWVAKQILQLGMGDALDDWLLEKIQLLRKGSVVASGIKRLEQILWPDGIFITKHSKRRPPSTVNSVQQSSGISSPKPNSQPSQQPMAISSPRLTPEQQEEAERRAKFVFELMIENAPAAVVGLVGRKEYGQCAKDLYFFLQSSVCLKQLAFDLLELLLLSAFPEMDYVFKKLHKEKHLFGELKS